MIQSKHKTGIRAKIKFYNWAKNKGVDLKNFNPENLCFDVPIIESSFKNRSAEVKENFNHQFNFKNR